MILCRCVLAQRWHNYLSRRWTQGRSTGDEADELPQDRRPREASAPPTRRPRHPAPQGEGGPDLSHLTDAELERLDQLLVRLGVQEEGSGARMLAHRTLSATDVLRLSDEEKRELEDLIRPAYHVSAGSRDGTLVD